MVDGRLYYVADDGRLYYIADDGAVVEAFSVRHDADAWCDSLNTLAGTKAGASHADEPGTQAGKRVRGPR